jgi:molecular chaperone GrpE
LVAKSKERDAACDKYVRAHAEFENLRKRWEKDKLDNLKYAKEEFVAEFMPILDSIDMAARHMEVSSDAKALKEGFTMIDQQVKKFLKDLGVERVKAVGEKFDPHLHEAVEVEETNEKKDGTIIEELKAGYSLNGRLIRPAAVKIVKNSDQKTENRGQRTEDRKKS